MCVYIYICVNIYIYILRSIIVVGKGWFLGGSLWVVTIYRSDPTIPGFSDLSAEFSELLGRLANDSCPGMGVLEVMKHI